MSPSWSALQIMMVSNTVQLLGFMARGPVSSELRSDVHGIDFDQDSCVVTDVVAINSRLPEQ